MTKTWDEINTAIKTGDAVVLTASEFKELAETESPESLAEKVDVVTVATFAPMCSSGVFINFGHDRPPIRLEELSLNGVPLYGGVAAVDAYLGATAELPGNPEYGGGHVIEALIKGEHVRLEGKGKGTDCYPGRSVDTSISMEDLNEFYFFNPRNVYQNYGAAANSGEDELRTYLGVLDPGLKTVSYATSGELSPFLNDPHGRFLGPGAAVWLAGSVGHVAMEGTQFNTGVKTTDKGLPIGPARTLALIADAKKAKPQYIAAAAVPGYGVSLFLGIGFAIPVLDADAARALSIRDSEIVIQVKDYALPERPLLLETDYASLRSGTVEIAGKTARTACSSSLARAAAIMEELKLMVKAGNFPLQKPFRDFIPESKVKSLPAREPSSANDALAYLGEEARGPAHYRPSRCVDCGACISHCPVDALSLEQDSRKLIYNEDICIACGRCSEICPRHAFGKNARS